MKDTKIKKVTIDGYVFDPDRIRLKAPDGCLVKGRWNGDTIDWMYPDRVPSSIKRELKSLMRSIREQEEATAQSV